MENLPSIFDSIWEFMAIPLIEFFVLLFFLYYFSDKSKVKTWINDRRQRVKKYYLLLKENQIIPGTGTVTSVTLAITIIVAIAGISRLAHTIGDIIPGNLETREELAMATFATSEDLSKIWSTQPKIEDFNELNQYILHIHYKQLRLFPDLANAYKAQYDSFGTIWTNRSFYKFLILYLFILQPLVMAILGIRAKNYFGKLFICVIILGICLVYNFKEHYDFIRTTTYLQTRNVRIMLESEIINAEKTQLNAYKKKIEDFQTKEPNQKPVAFFPSTMAHIWEFKDR